MVRVTCVELPDKIREDTWSRLFNHIEHQETEILVLNEMPATPWFVSRKPFLLETAQESVRTHNQFLEKLSTFNIHIISSRPIENNRRIYNEAFLLSNQIYLPVHTKYYFPDEPGFYEATWFSRKKRAFDTFNIDKSLVGVMLCTELWFSEHARTYGKLGAHFIFVPRATSSKSLESWIIGLQHAAIVSGTFVVSSNRVGKTLYNDFAGYGCIIDPDGTVLSHTSRGEPYVTLDLDPKLAEIAKKRYPRYVN